MFKYPSNFKAALLDAQFLSLLQLFMSSMSVIEVQQDLQTIQSQVRNVTSDIPLHKLTTFSDTLSTVQENQNYISWIDLAEKLR